MLLELKLLIRKIFLKLNTYVDPVTPANELDYFFAKLKPVTTDKKLVRVGGKTDSGYLIPNDLSGIRYCFSPGVAESADFEEDLAKLHIRSFLADYSVDSAPVQNDMFDFEKKFLGTSNDSIYTTLENWMASKVAPGEAEMILQMDIEGAEYEVLFDTSRATLNRFRILVIEFHELYKLLNPFGFKIINACFNKLLENFEIVHIHPNNCFKTFKFKNYEIPPVMEFTFLRKDRIQNSSRTLSFPHQLDKKNTQKKDIVLPKCWYTHSVISE